MPPQPYEKSVYPTSILHLIPSNNELSSSESPLFVWIPGNPGLLEYYEEMLLHLHKQNPNWEILGISHAGMRFLGPMDERTPIYSLKQQIDHKLEVINQFSSANRSLIIMGHSVGAFMAQKVALSNNLVGKVVKLGLVTPTIIDIHTSEKGILLTRAFYWFKNLPELVAWGSDLFFNKILPLIFVKLILAILMGCSKDSSPVLASEILVKNSEFVRQALGLASYEMQEIRSDWVFQKEVIDHCKRRDIMIWFLFSQSDHWVSNETRENLIMLYKDNNVRNNIKIQVSDKIPHSFVIKHSKYVVDEYF